jgi:hypothetical protein
MTWAIKSLAPKINYRYNNLKENKVNPSRRNGKKDLIMH